MTRRSWVKVGFVYGTSLVPVGSLGGVRDGLTPPARPTSGQETRQIFAPRVPQILEGIRVSALTWAWLAVRCIRHSSGLQQACAFAKRCWRCAAGYEPISWCSLLLLMAAQKSRGMKHQTSACKITM